MERPLRCITRIQGGIGNQLFCYAHGSAVAERLGAELVLDVSELDRGDLYGRRFELGSLGVTAPRISSTLLGGPAGRLVRPLFRRAFGSRIYREPAVPPDVKGVPWIYLDGYWQADAGINLRQRQLRERINVQERLLSETTRALSKRLAADRAIGVHLRSYGEEKFASRRTTPGPAYYAAALERLFAEFGPRPVFVASDIPRASLPFPDAIRRHLVETGERSPLEDLHLLRNCAFHVLCNSSFGWWGAFLAESACTYYPHRAGYFHYPSPAHGWRVIADAAS